MIRRSTLVLVIIFGVLLLLAVGLQQKWFTSGAITPTPTTIPPILDALPKDQLASIQVAIASNTTLTLSKQSDGWIINEPTGVSVDQSKVNQLISSLYSLKPDGTDLSGKALETFGITPDSQVITLKGQNSKTITLRIGSMTPTQNDYYIQADDHPAVIVPRFSLESVLKLLDPIALQATTATP